MNRFFLDTEFSERADVRTIELISLALVRESDGAELYLVSNEFNPELCNEFVQTFVLPKLGHPDTGVYNALTNAEIAQRVLEFMPPASKPEVWGYFADYDWVVLCWLFGPMVSLPNGYPYYCRDLKQAMDERGVLRSTVSAAIGEPSPEHNALGDARWIRNLARFVLPQRVESGA